RRQRIGDADLAVILAGAAEPVREGKQMGGGRLPGPYCSVERWLEIDEGTMCRQPSPVPGTNGLVLPTADPWHDADVESADYDLSYRAEGGKLSTFLKVHYANGKTKDVPLDAITREQPRLWAAKQEALTIMDEYNAMFILQSFPAVWFVLTMIPGAATGTASPRT